MYYFYTIIERVREMTLGYFLRVGVRYNYT